MGPRPRGRRVTAATTVPKLVVNGYYGKQNLGDEAFVCVLKDQFPDARFCNHSNPHPTEPQFKGYEEHVIIGGGEFSPWMVAGAPPGAKLYGLSLGLIRDGYDAERIELLRRFTYLSVRDVYSLELALAWGLKAVFSGDLAYLLRPGAADPTFREKFVVIPQRNIAPWPFLEGIPSEKLLFSRFHPQDLENIDTRGIPAVFADSPTEMLASIATASRVLVWGRLHAKILAHAVGVPWVEFGPDRKSVALAATMTKYSVKELKQSATNAITSIKEKIYA